MKDFQNKRIKEKREEVKRRKRKTARWEDYNKKIFC